MSIENKRTEAKKQFLTVKNEIDIANVSDVDPIDWKKKYETAQKIMEASTAKLISVQAKLSVAEAKIAELVELTDKFVTVSNDEIKKVLGGIDE